MGGRFLVIGSGMQGCAAGYALAAFGKASEIWMADRSAEAASSAAKRINDLLSPNQKIAFAKTIDARDEKALTELMKEKRVDGVLSATSYELNLGLTRAAIEAGVSLVDLGGNTPVVFEQLKLHEAAVKKNISIIPDCGLAPGLGNALAAYGISLLDECETVDVRCGGLPQKKVPPLDYKLVFSVRGLTNEYFGKAWIIRNGKREEIETFSELESLEFPQPLGKLEAFTTTGGSSTCPWTFEKRVKDYTYKTIRYPGHFDKMKAMLDLGLLDEEPLQVGEQTIVPREVFHTVAQKRLLFPEIRDLVVLRTECRGRKAGKPLSLRFDLLDFHDEKTGFTAMERSTAFPAALVLHHAANGKAQKGVKPLEIAIDQRTYLHELSAWGLKIEGLLLN